MLKRSIPVVFGRSILVVCLALSPGQTEAADLSHESGKVKPKQLIEISGVAISRANPDHLWVHNDGDDGQLFALTPGGQLAALVTTPAKVDDLEDIAIGPGPSPSSDFIYLGDIGDNDQRRREIRIVRIGEPALSGDRPQQIVVSDIETYRLTYPDGPHNAESLFIDASSRQLWIATKEDRVTRMYSASLDELRDGGLTILTAAGEVPIGEVSGGDISRDGRMILLRSGARGWLWRRNDGEDIADALARPPQVVDVLGKRQSRNGEAVAFHPSGLTYFTVSEGKKQSLYEFRLPTGGEAAAPQ